MSINLDRMTALGWREWVAFPDWGIDYLKAKVDTGARTSSLHVRNLEYFEKDGAGWARFTVFPWQKSSKETLRVEAPVASYKEVKSSSGCLEKRPVVIARIIVAERELEAELTLTNRSTMGFRMLLGRAVLKKNFLILPGQSYLGGKPPKEVRQKNRGIEG